DSRTLGGSRLEDQAHLVLAELQLGAEETERGLGRVARGHVDEPEAVALRAHRGEQVRSRLVVAGGELEHAAAAVEDRALVVDGKRLEREAARPHVLESLVGPLPRLALAAVR